MLRPPTVIAPEVADSSPATSRSAVVLPHPDGPTRIMNSPSGMSSVRRSIAVASPANTLVTSWKDTSAMRLLLRCRTHCLIPV